MKKSELSKLIREEIRKVLKESDINNVQGCFADYNIKLTSAFDLNKFAKFIQQSPDTAATLICNLEDVEVMKDVARGNYRTFDMYDSNQFNDSYDDMVDDLGI